MLTIDDVRSIPLFSTLAVAELERLATTSADLHLAAGEFAVHEGGDRALYAVLTGRIEVVKLFDGIERTLGWRVPGTIFGEVPIAFGTVFVGDIGRRNPRASSVWTQALLRCCGDVPGGRSKGRRARTRAHRRATGHRSRATQGAL
jgi:hypothetical protein